MRITGVIGSCSRAAPRMSSPLTCGIRTSVSTMSCGAAFDRLEAGLPTLGGGDLEPFLLEQDPEGIENAGFVVDDQHR